MKRCTLLDLCNAKATKAAVRKIHEENNKSYTMSWSMMSFVNDVEQVVTTFVQRFFFALKHAQCAGGPREVGALDGVEGKRRGGAFHDVQLEMVGVYL